MVQKLSKLCIAIGLILIAFAMYMDVTFGGFFNFYKANQQRNLLLLGGVLFFCGTIATVIPLLVRNRRYGENTPEYEGLIDLSNPSYQLFLTKYYFIEINPKLKKFTINNDGFNTLDEVLQEADCRYRKWIDNKTLGKEKILLDKVRKTEILALKKANRVRLNVTRRQRKVAFWNKVIKIGPIVAVLIILICSVDWAFKRIQAPAFAKKRSEMLPNMVRTNTIFGFTLGEVNNKKLAILLGNGAIVNDRPFSVSCLKENCSPLLGFEYFAPIVEALSFQYCEGPLDENDARLVGVDIIFADREDISKITKLIEGIKQNFGPIPIISNNSFLVSIALPIQTECRRSNCIGSGCNSYTNSEFYEESTLKESQNIIQTYP